MCHCLAAGIATILFVAGSAAASRFQESRAQAAVCPFRRHLPWWLLRLIASWRLFEHALRRLKLSPDHNDYSGTGQQQTGRCAATPISTSAKPLTPSSPTASHAQDDDDHDGCSGACAGHHHHDEGAAQNDHASASESANLTDNVPRGDAAALAKSIEDARNAVLWPALPARATATV